MSEKPGRRWIVCDLSRFAILTTRKRLLAISDVRPFVVQNLGKYERSVWAGPSWPGAYPARAARGERFGPPESLRRFPWPPHRPYAAPSTTSHTQDSSDRPIRAA